MCIYIYISLYICVQIGSIAKCLLDASMLACSICPMKVEPLEMKQEVEQVASLYAGPAVAIKVRGLCVHDTPKRTG